jgi:hypothetical protein
LKYWYGWYVPHQGHFILPFTKGNQTMTGKLLALATAAGLLIGTSAICYAENGTSEQISGAKIQEKGAVRTKTAAVNSPGRVIQEDGAPSTGTSFAAPQGTTGLKDPTESYDRGPSVPSDKR